MPCKIFNISDTDWDHSELEDLTEKDFWDVVTEAEKLFSANGIRISSYEELHEVCVDDNGDILGASVVGSPGRPENDHRITIRFSVVVAESARRQGIARKLIQSIMISYPSDEFFLEAWVVNPHMAVLLNSLGFESFDGDWSQESPFMHHPRCN